MAWQTVINLTPSRAKHLLTKCEVTAIRFGDEDPVPVGRVTSVNNTKKEVRFIPSGEAPRTLLIEEISAISIRGDICNF